MAFQALKRLLYWRGGKYIFIPKQLSVFFSFAIISIDIESDVEVLIFRSLLRTWNLFILNHDLLMNWSLLGYMVPGHSFRI